MLLLYSNGLKLLSLANSSGVEIPHLIRIKYLKVGGFYEVFKYLVFIIITICSSSAFAVTYKAVDGSKNSATGSTPDAACRAFYSKYITYAGAPAYSRAESGACYYSSGVFAYYSLIPDPPLECPEVGYPMYVYFDAGGKIPQQRCQPLGDKFCVFKAKPDSIVLNHSGNRQSTVLYNVQKTPVSTCTPLDQGQCDKTILTALVISRLMTVVHV